LNFCVELIGLIKIQGLHRSFLPRFQSCRFCLLKGEKVGFVLLAKGCEFSRYVLLMSSRRASKVFKVFADLVFFRRQPQ
jgi:hypothetical protein